MTGSIICGVDDSESAKGAARVARQLSAQLGYGQLMQARCDGSDLRVRRALVNDAHEDEPQIVAHVAEPAYIPYAAAAPFGGTAGRDAVVEEVESQEKAAERLLEQVVVTAGLVDAERRPAVGVPAEGLADLADAEDAELIVVGSRGRGAFKSAFLGSVSNSLVGIARCPVLIVPPGVAEAHEPSSHRTAQAAA